MNLSPALTLFSRMPWVSSEFLPFSQAGMGVIQGAQAALQSRRSSEETQLLLLLADEMQEGGEQLYTGNSSWFLHRDIQE